MKKFLVVDEYIGAFYRKLHAFFLLLCLLGLAVRL